MGCGDVAVVVVFDGIVGKGRVGALGEGTVGDVDGGVTLDMMIVGGGSA